MNLNDQLDKDGFLIPKARTPEEIEELRQAFRLYTHPTIPSKGVSYRALASRVLVVASADMCVGDWAAYIDAVPGQRHDNEWQDVVEHGSKLQKETAEQLFSGFATTFKWRL